MTHLLLLFCPFCLIVFIYFVFQYHMFVTTGVLELQCACWPGTTFRSWFSLSLQGTGPLNTGSHESTTGAFTCSAILPAFLLLLLWNTSLQTRGLKGFFYISPRSTVTSGAQYQSSVMCLLVFCAGGHTHASQVFSHWATSLVLVF